MNKKRHLNASKNKNNQSQSDSSNDEYKENKQKSEQEGKKYNQNSNKKRGNSDSLENDQIVNFKILFFTINKFKNRRIKRITQMMKMIVFI